MTYESDAVTLRLQRELAAMKHLVVHERGRLLDVFNAFDDFRKEAADLVLRARKMNEAQATTAAVELTKLSSKAASKLTMVCVALATEDCGCSNHEISAGNGAAGAESVDPAQSVTSNTGSSTPTAPAGRSALSEEEIERAYVERPIHVTKVIPFRKAAFVVKPPRGSGGAA